VNLESDPYEPYRISQAIRAGGLIFVSGQAAIGENGELVGVGDFDAQAEQAFRNLPPRPRGGRLGARPDRQGDDLPPTNFRR
jgi:hypothetical protein